MDKDKVLTIAAMVCKGHTTNDINIAVTTAVELITAVDAKFPDTKERENAKFPDTKEQE